jgi:hypothetical protein
MRDGRVDRKVEQVDEAFQAFSTLGIQKAVGRQGREKPTLLSRLQEITDTGMEQGFAPCEVDDADTEALQIVQILLGRFDRYERGRLLPDVTETALRIAAVGDVVVAEYRTHDRDAAARRGEWKLRPPARRFAAQGVS